VRRALRPCPVPRPAPGGTAQIDQLGAA